MILNQRFPQVLEGKISYNTRSRYFDIFDFNTETTYWYIEVDKAESLCESILRKIIPSYAIDLIKKRYIKLVITNAYEGISEFPHEIYKNIVIGLGIDEDSIIYFSEKVDAYQDVISYCKVFNKKPIKTCVPQVAEFTMSLLLSDMNQNNINTNLQKKRFICLNRRWRPHRPVLVALMHFKDILKEGYVSLIQDIDYNWANQYELLVDINRTNDSLLNLLQSNKKEILSLSSLTVDLEDLSDYSNIFGLKDHLLPFYRSTCFSVVTETNFYKTDFFSGSLYLTEKIFRPMCYLQPFVVLARPGYLKTLRSLGYKTFDGIFDESYDREEDDPTRMLMVVNQIEKLCKMPIDEFHSTMIQCRDICEHNYKLLLSIASKPKLKLDK